MAQGFSFPQCFDPYLRFAISTNFVHFEEFEQKNPELFFLVELKKGGLARQFRREMSQAGFRVEFGPSDENSQYVTVRVEKAAVLKDSPALPVWENLVSRVELSLPLKPSPIGPNPRIERWRQPRHSEHLLIGVLDNGCPFAAAHFLANSGAASTRVLAIWDQNEGRMPIPVNDSGNNPCELGQVPPDFGYGLEFRRDSEAPGAPNPRQIGLDEWIVLHSSPSGRIDEDGCYADAESIETATQMHQTLMRRRQSHGAHVMDLFAGRIPAASRIGPSKVNEDRRDPPSWKPGSDDASKADVVFVQFPDAGIRDHTGVWLKAYVEHGIRYVLSCADPHKTKNVVINLSYGPTTGPHDGTAVLEATLAALVAEFAGQPGKPKLEIVLAAGNAYLSEGHVAFERTVQQPNHVEWTWRLLPDNTVLCFAEVWMKKADAARAVVTLTSPTGKNVPVDPPIDWGNNKMWRLEVGRTITYPGLVPPQEHGDYRINVTGIPVNAQVHAYVARTDPNMGVRTGAKRSYFVDAPWEQTRAAAAAYTRRDGEFDKTGALLDRYGTLNGIATGLVAIGQEMRLHVAGGYIHAHRCGAAYSSAGEARGDPLMRRRGPDYALLCDESYALGGIRAGGNRSGSAFRMIGTSAAAPQLARHIANGAIPPPRDPPADPRKRGRGNIDPP